jgi:hypothetical protein
VSNLRPDVSAEPDPAKRLRVSSGAEILMGHRWLPSAFVSWVLHLFSGLILALAASGCTDGAGPRVQRTRLGDTLWVHSLEPRVSDTLIPREILRIGRSDGPLEYVFSLISTFALGPSGEVLVHDQGEGIRRFDAQGRYLGHLARRGEGPGEVRYVVGLAPSGSGTVAAYDLGSSRITIFRGDGTTKTIRRPDGYAPYHEDALLFHDDGSLWVGINPAIGWEESAPHPRPVFARFSDSGALVDTVFTPRSLGNLCPLLSMGKHRDGFWEDKREPHFPKAKWSLGPDGTIAFGCPASYSFDVIRRESPLVRINRPWTPLFLSEEEEDFILKWGLMPKLPSELPAYARVVVPGDGRIWVWPTQPRMKYTLSRRMQEATGETYTWLVAWQGAFDVFDADGEWLAVVKLPEEARYSGHPTEPSVVIRGDTIWAVAQDSMDVQYVVRYQVDGLPSGR